MAVKKEYFTIEETAKKLGIDRSTVYLKMKVLKIGTTKFEGNRKKYIAAKDVEQLRTLLNEPWKIEQARKEGNAAFL